MKVIEADRTQSLLYVDSPRYNSYGLADAHDRSGYSEVYFLSAIDE